MNQIVTENENGNSLVNCSVYKVIQEVNRLNGISFRKRFPGRPPELLVQFWWRQWCMDTESETLSGWKRLLVKMVKPDSLTGQTLSDVPGYPSALVGLVLPRLQAWPVQWPHESQAQPVRALWWDLTLDLRQKENLSLFWVTSQKNPDVGSSGRRGSQVETHAWRTKSVQTDSEEGRGQDRGA